MSWRWLIDARGKKVGVDWPRLLIVVLVIAFLVPPLRYAFHSDPIFGTVVSAAAGVLLIVLDVRLRR